MTCIVPSLISRNRTAVENVDQRLLNSNRWSELLPGEIRFYLQVLLCYVSDTRIWGGQ